PILLSDPLGDDAGSKDWPFDNPKANRSLRKYEKRFNKELKRLSGDTEENRKQAYINMNKYDTKNWMWVRQTNLQHLPVNGQNDNGENYTSAEDLFRYKQYLEKKAVNDKQADAQPILPLKLVNKGVVPALDETITDVANFHTYQLPEGASGQITINLT